MRSITASSFFFLAALCVPFSAHSGDVGEITGRLTKGGVGIRGMVAFFNEKTGPPPAPDRYYRIPDAVAFADDDGRFRSKLVAGKYYVAAIVRKGIERLGPPVEGDIIYLCRDDSNSLRLFNVDREQILDIGTIGEDAVFVADTAQTTGATVIRGKVIGPDNRPVQGIYVVAFYGKNTGTKPMFISKKTTKSGRYVLRVHQGGRFFLLARSSPGGGPPEVGSLVGGYGGLEPRPVEINTNSKVGRINIRLKRFNGPENGRYATRQNR